jgi:hypothetical protein
MAGSNMTSSVLKKVRLALVQDSDTVHLLSGEPKMNTLKGLEGKYTLTI